MADPVKPNAANSANSSSTEIDRAAGTAPFNNGLGLTEIINVTAVPSETLLSFSNPNNILIITSEAAPVFSDSNPYKIYKSPAEIAADFKTINNSKVVKMANAIFSQTKNILTGGGYLVIAKFNPSETVGDAITRISSLVAFTGVLVDKLLIDADITTLYGALPSNKLFFCPRKEPTAVDATTGIFDIVRSASKSNFRCLYYAGSTDEEVIVMAAAYASRAMSVDFDSFGSTQTMELKSLVGVTPDKTIKSDIFAKIKAAGADTYTNVEGIPSVLTSGKNRYFDQVHNQLWLVNALQVQGFNFFRGSSTKVPQTVAGQIALKNAYRTVCEKAVFNGYAAPGEWTIPEVFGDVNDFRRNIREQGFYIWMAPITQQASTEREERKAPVTRIAIKEAGAIHSSNVIINLNA